MRDLAGYEVRNAPYTISSHVLSYVRSFLTLDKSETRQSVIQRILNTLNHTQLSMLSMEAKIQNCFRTARNRFPSKAMGVYVCFYAISSGVSGRQSLCLVYAILSFGKNGQI